MKTVEFSLLRKRRAGTGTAYEAYAKRPEEPSIVIDARFRFRFRRHLVLLRREHLRLQGIEWIPLRKA